MTLADEMAAMGLKTFLPTKVEEATKMEPRLLILISQPKIGKTRLLMSLPNCLVIDLEDSKDLYSGLAINVKSRVIKQNALIRKHNAKVRDENKGDDEKIKKLIKPLFNVYRMFIEIAKEIKRINEQLGKPMYDFIAIDSTTALEELAEELATKLYVASPQGQNFLKEGGRSVVTELGHGYGYRWQREAWDDLWEPYQGLAGVCLIYAGHTKEASIKKKGQDVKVNDIALTGKLKLIVNSRADGTGFMYRDTENPNKNILSFISGNDDTISGVRQEYLSGREIVISEKLPDGTLKTYWEEIFPETLKGSGK